MWYTISCVDGHHCFDGAGCEIRCKSLAKAKLLAKRLNDEKVCGNTILPDFIKEYM